MKKHLNILQKINSSINEETIKLPIKDSGIDSIDLVVIRVALEKHFNFEISDTKWYSFSSLGKALIYFDDNQCIEQSSKVQSKEIKLNRDYEITMPQMANNALSENWLLKEIGDIHWELLTKGIGQSSSSFSDDAGNRLYAAFLRINYHLSSLSKFLENDKLSIEADIMRFGNNTYFTNQKGKSGNNFLIAKVMTSFSFREYNDNTKISKSNPIETKNCIIQLKQTPEFLNEYRLLRKHLTTEHISNKIKFQIKKNTSVLNLDLGEYNIDSNGLLFRKETGYKERKFILYNINPYYEINGVGFLYFASYPIISDYCESRLLNASKNSSLIPDWSIQSSTIARDIFYYANCNSNDRIIYQMNEFEAISEIKIKIGCSLYRESDKKKIADIFTIKELIEI